MKTKQLGFSVIELVIGLVVVGALAGIGYTVYHRHHAVKSTTASSGSTAAVLNKTASASSDVQSITNQLSQQASSEAGVEAQTNSADQTAAANANAANSNLGGAYNEANF